MADKKVEEKTKNGEKKAEPALIQGRKLEMSQKFTPEGKRVVVTWEDRPRTRRFRVKR